MANAEPKSVFETPLDDADEARKDAAADAEIEAGQGVPHERVREWLKKLGQGEKAPIPTA
jgi:predicted transcriptional regulator